MQSFMYCNYHTISIFVYTRLIESDHFDTHFFHTKLVFFIVVLVIRNIAHVVWCIYKWPWDLRNFHFSYWFVFIKVKLWTIHPTQLLRILFVYCIMFDVYYCLLNKCSRYYRSCCFSFFLLFGIIVEDSFSRELSL